MTKLYLLLFICVSSSTMGCASVNRSSRVSTPQPVAGNAEVFVRVNLYRLGAVRVPISPQGATLRSVVADARDLASQGGAIVLTHAINDKNAFENLFESETYDPVDRLWIGEECVAVSRSNTRMIVPEVLVTSTAMGSSRVVPGDFVQTVPLALVAALRKAQAATITLTSDHFDEREIQVPEQAKLSQIVKFTEWNNFANNFGPAPKLNPAMLRPNVAVISRAYDGVNHMLIIPCTVTDDRNADVESDIMQDPMLGLYKTLQFSDGDIVHLTRLENIPAVALGLSLPVPQRPSGGGTATAADCMAHCDQSYDQTRKKFPLLPAPLPAIQQVKQQIATHILP